MYSSLFVFDVLIIYNTIKNILRNVRSGTCARPRPLAASRCPAAKCGGTVGWLVGASCELEVVEALLYIFRVAS